MPVSRIADRPGGGFTLIETLLVLLIFAMATGLVVIGVGSLTTGVAKDLPDQVLRRTVRDARLLAAVEKAPMQLAYDAETAALVVIDENGEERAREEIGVESPGDLEIRFYRRMPFTGLPRGGSFGEPDLRETPRVLFGPDRSSTPFVAEVRLPTGSVRYPYDTFSHAEIPTEER